MKEICIEDKGVYRSVQHHACTVKTTCMKAELMIVQTEGDSVTVILSTIVRPHSQLLAWQACSKLDVPWCVGVN